MYYEHTISWENETRVVIPISFSTCYAALRYSRSDLTRPDGENQKAKKIIEAFHRCGGQHLRDQQFWDKKISPSGMDLFYLLTEHPGYYLKQAEHSITHDIKNWSYFSKLFKGRILVELCAGDMRKTVEWLKRLPKDDWPTKIIINDIVADNIKEATAQLWSIGYRLPRYHVVPLPGDMEEAPFWDSLVTKTGDQPCVLLMQGATLNDFIKNNDKEDGGGEIPFLRHLCKMPKETLFVFSGDNTTNPRMLSEAYVDNYFAKYFLIGGIAHYFYTNLAAFEERPSKSPLSLISAEKFFDISHRFDVSSISPIIRAGGKTNFQNIMHSGEGKGFVCVSDSVGKPAESEMRRMFAARECKLTEGFPARSDREINYSFFEARCGL